MALSQIKATSMSADALVGWTETASIGTLDSATETLTGIPSTITQLYMAWDGVTHSSTTPSVWGVRLGTSSGIVTSGYKSNAFWGYDGSNNFQHEFYTAHAVGDIGNWANSEWSGQFYFWNLTSNTWLYNATLRNSDGSFDVMEHWSGRVALGGTLDRISINTGTGTLSGGTVKTYYK